MRDSSTLTRRATRPLVVMAVAAIALLATTACQAGEQAAATVNGHEIKASTIRSNLEDLAAAAKKGGAPDQFAGSGRDTFKIETADQLLSLHIVTTIIGQDLAKRGIKVTTADRTAGEAEVCTDPNTGQSTPGCLDQDPKDLKALRLGLAGQLQALGRTSTAPVPAPTDAQLETEARAQYDQIAAQNPTALEQVCLLAAAVPDVASANALKQQVQAGADFVTAATPVATQPVVSQEQCGSASQVTGELATAQTGDVVGPITTQQGIFVAKIVRRDTQTFEAVAPALKKQVQDSVAQQRRTIENQAGNVAVQKLLKTAKVDVSSKYGRWDQKTGRVAPPKVPKGAGPTTTTTTSPAATAPATAPPATEPPATAPPATEPPATAPPATEPPATAPATGAPTSTPGG